jgi:hypothetical protein
MRTLKNPQGLNPNPDSVAAGHTIGIEKSRGKIT